jgi:hypothetical protein
LYRLIRRALEFIGLLFEEYKAARRVLLIWACILITVSVDRFWDSLPMITEPVAKVLIVILGLLGVVLGFYQWSRERDK